MRSTQSHRQLGRLQDSPVQEAHLVKLYRFGQESPAGLAELFNVDCSTAYRAIQRAGA